VGDAGRGRRFALGAAPWCFSPLPRPRAQPDGRYGPGRPTDKAIEHNRSLMRKSSTCSITSRIPSEQRFGQSRLSTYFVSAPGFRCIEQHPARAQRAHQRRLTGHIDRGRRVLSCGQRGEIALGPAFRASPVFLCRTKLLPRLWFIIAEAVFGGKIGASRCKAISCGDAGTVRRAQGQEGGSRVSLVPAHGGSRRTTRCTTKVRLFYNTAAVACPFLR